MGSIPEAAVQNGTGENVLRHLFSRFGDVVSVTVRKKPGLNKSWALVWLPLLVCALPPHAGTLQITFRLESSIAEAMEAFIALADLQARHPTVDDSVTNYRSQHSTFCLPLAGREGQITGQTS